MNDQHPATVICSKGAERKSRQRVEEEAHTGVADAFQAYGRPLEAVQYFKQPGRVLTVYRYDWLEVVSNLRKAWRKLAKM